jgi:alpha-galactosidase
MGLNRLILMLLVCFSTALAEGVQISFEPVERRWTLSNEVLRAQFAISPEGIFGMERIEQTATGVRWSAAGPAATSPLRFTVGDLTVGPRTFFRLAGHWQEDAGKGGKRQVIELEDAAKRARIRLHLEIYPGQPVLRYWTEVRNLLSRTVYARLADMVPWRLAAEDGEYRWFRVNQWTIVPREQNFEPLESRLRPEGNVMSMQSGSRGTQCAWWALRDGKDRGLFAGWEFDGRALATARYLEAEGYLQFSATIQELYHPVEPGEVFLVPPAFLGVFQGDWDEAGYRTQRFVEQVLAKPMPDDEKFPYVAWDSWGHQYEFDEAELRRSAEIAAKLGVELFIVDLGWARAIGDWYSDRTKFPSGMRALSDYVHSLGMKFGLHLAFAEAAPETPVLQQNPDWTSSEEYYYFGAKSLCLAHKPVRDWLIEELTRVIQSYNVDWVLQDGENMVKKCTKETHTHDPRDSNYAGAVDGLNVILREVQRRTPNTVWENCEDGGNMMTFNMVRNYVTSITNDANGALGARQAAYGATYPFPPRYVDRYMPEETITKYTTRSFMFGGPWILMNRLTEMGAGELELLASEIATFKKIRSTVRDGKVFHLTARPATGRIDALQAHHEKVNRSIAVVTRDSAAASSYTLRPRGLDPDVPYRVTFQDDSRVLLMNGSQLMETGVRVNLPSPESAEIVYIEPR